MSTPRRIEALDIFRGFTIFLMIIVNNPGSWLYVYSPLRHAKWHGCTVTDLVFPFFIFILGASMRFAFVRWHYFPSRKFKQHILWRAISIFIAGCLIQAFPFVRQDWDWSTFRFMGVLQRIAIVYACTSLLVIYFDFKKLLIISISTLIAYWALLYFGGGVDPYSLEGNLIKKVDIFIFGETHLYQGNGIPFDPEGLLSTIPTIITAIIGFLVGGMIHTAKDFVDNVKRMLVFGTSLSAIGLGWNILLPINKQLWTSSYVLFTAGIATIFLATLLYLIDIRKKKYFFFIFKVFGTNSIFLFIMSGLWTKTLLRTQFDLNGQSISGYAYLYKTLCVPISGFYSGSLLFSIIHAIGFWIILYWLYKKKIYVKL